MAHKIQTWTYSGRPSDSEKDAVRFLIGDTDPCDKLMDDCEIQYLLALEGSPINAAICACLALAAHFSRDFDGSFGSTKSSKPAEAYRQLAKDLKAKCRLRPVVAFAGGISSSDKRTRELNSDRVRPIFIRDMHDQNSEKHEHDLGDPYGA